MDSLKIHEVFYSIQGESTLAGKPTVFVRTATCNLRCGYCDTKPSFWKAEVKTLDWIVEQVKQHPTRYVCLTGGEPLGQAAIYPLMQRLLADNYTVSLETNGSFLVDRVPREVIKVIDLKCPDSGEEASNVWANVDHVTPQDQFKFVVSSRKDFDWACEKIKDFQLWEKAQLLFSPVQGAVGLQDLAKWVLSLKFPTTLQYQMHKVIWGADARGV